MKVIALLGRRDEPTDGVADYCSFLAQALRQQNIDLEIVHVPWAERGWRGAMQWLSQESRNWSGQWVLLQYTAMAWSRRGFPFRVLAVQRLLLKRGVRCAVVFHDVKLDPLPGIHNRIRRKIQYWIMARLLARSTQSISTISTGELRWPHSNQGKLAFIPIGANIPVASDKKSFTPNGEPKIIGVFCISGKNYRQREVTEILFVVEQAKARVPALQLEIFGNGTPEAAPLLEGPLRRMGIKYRLSGVLPAEEIARTLQSLDAFLCVRGELSLNRGSALAAIACGVPIIAFGQRGRYTELDEAGIEFAQWGALDTLGDAAVRVLTDAALWQDLHERNRRAHAKYFSWDAVAARYTAMLQSFDTPPK
ncbi:MAG: glycosyltransferase [Candidatus Acidiferrales bacterium]